MNTVPAHSLHFLGISTLMPLSKGQRIITFSSIVT
jgi:hypothetical protein